jgi:lipopolysaccharide transport system permease protein
MIKDQQRKHKMTRQLTEDAGMLKTVVPLSKSIIEPPRGWHALDIREVWHYRELLYFLAWRDVKVRYKQTVIGLLWVILQPFLTMVVFSLIFGMLMNVPTDGEPYPVFSFVALLPWTFFSGALSRAGVSLVMDANLISKIYFPRIILPLAAILSSLVDFAVSFIIMFGMLAFYGIVPGAAILVLPFLLGLSFLTAFAFGLWLSALNVKYRDVTHIIPFLIQFWFFLTPVVYPSSIIPQAWHFLYRLNPMTGVIEGFRWALLGQQNVPTTSLLLSTLIVLAALLGGLFYFRRMEYEFADVV